MPARNSARDRTSPVTRLDNLYSDPLRFVAAIAGWWWMSNLIIGLLISHDFSTSPAGGTTVHIWFIPVTVNGFHVLVHGVSGALGLLAATRRSWASVYLGVFAMIYVGWGAAGVVAHGTLWILVGDTFGNWVHVVEGGALGLTLTSVAALELSERGNASTRAA